MFNIFNVKGRINGKSLVVLILQLLAELIGINMKLHYHLDPRLCILLLFFIFFLFFYYLN